MADRFASHVGETFSIEGTDTTLVLDRIESIPSPPPTEQFSLFFTSTGEKILDQGTYRLNSGPLGPLDIFLVPVAAPSGVELQACFNLVGPTT